jgi:crossover junction endodeoxyribonuclease RusA
VTATPQQPAGAGDLASRSGQVSTPGPVTEAGVCAGQGRAGSPQAGTHAGTGLPAGTTHTATPDEGRTWRIEFPPGMPLLNANNRLHFRAKARIVAQIRETAWGLAKEAKIPLLERARIDGYYDPPDKRTRDAANWADTAKAATDGLVDAHVLPDDSSEYLEGPFMHIGQVRKPGRFVLFVTELLNPSETPHV